MSDAALPQAQAGDRFRLRAYEHTNACRAAFIINWLVTARPASRPEPKIERSELIKAWGRRHPRHAEQTGRSRIPRRVSLALTELRAAGIVQVDEQWITVLDADLLAMSAGNLLIVEGPDGFALRPSLWASRPACPPDLLPIQDELQAMLAASKGA